MARFSIRPATPDDAAAVTKLLRASYPVLMKSAYTAGVLAAALPSMTRANPDLLASGTYFVAQTDTDELVGCGGWTRQAPGTAVVEGDIGHVRHFGTHPDWTGRGIGRALYEACEDQAAAAGIARFNCFASLNAEGFYAALGFERVGPIEVAMPDASFPGVLMRRDL